MKAVFFNTKSITRQIGGISFVFRSDIIDKKEMDTKVSSETGGTLCWISGEDKSKFINELTDLIAKYSI